MDSSVVMFYGSELPDDLVSHYWNCDLSNVRECFEEWALMNGLHSVDIESFTDGDGIQHHFMYCYRMMVDCRVVTEIPCDIESTEEYKDIIKFRKITGWECEMGWMVID